jgi:LuxR family transcriptional regulator, maltose regulon positive regulatory protein
VPQDLPHRAAARRPARRRPARPVELLRSKLAAPVARAGLIERPHHLDSLSRASDRRFVSVLAPPGYGKTTLLGQWNRGDARTFAWVSLDSGDNDPVVLLTYIAEALGTDGSIGPAVFKALAAPGESLWARGLPRLGAALAARREPVVLVLDNVHVIEDRRCLDALVALASHVPVGSQLVFSGRIEPSVGLASMRADGDLVEVDAASLALNDVEAQLLLQDAGADVTKAEAAQLNEHAEGWAAGLYLAALSISGGKSSPAAFGGDDRFVTDYLRAEELSHTGPEEREFLLRSSVLETISGPLCDAVLERSGSTSLLERLEHDNLFVVPLDHTRTWYRFHHFFREMLQAELERADPELVHELRRRAASWCEANARPEEAIEYARAAADRESLARVVETNAFAYIRSGRIGTVERWLSAFDDADLLRRYPGVTVFGVVVHAFHGRSDLAERWALTVEAADSAGPMSDGSPASAWIAIAQALVARKGIEQMRLDAERAVAELVLSSPWRTAALLFLGVALRVSGDPRGAEPILTEAAESAFAGGAVWPGVIARSELALVALEDGDLARAEAEATLARELVDDAPTADHVVTAILLAATAQIAVARKHGAQARQALAAAHRLRPLLAGLPSWLSVRVQLELAKAHLELRDPRGASTLCQEAEEILRRRPRLGSLAAEAEEVRMRIVTTAEESDGWASTLTAAELRLLPLLTTHLSFREIAERLYVSRNTVKTQAIAVYRKLDASSRSEAIERAVALGLVDAAPAAQAADFTRSG